MNDNATPWRVGESPRADGPLYFISGILLLAFATLAIFGDGRSHDERAARSPPPQASALDALPASAEDDRTTASSLAPGDARARNAAVPFADAKLSPARGFAFRGTAADRTRARECLALAALAEAGAGDDDQRAVMQVVLNRVRHPAFAKTVCGVIFEGSERATGCQFSFTCDGSLARTYPEALWSAARRRAEEALGGRVYAPVGNATHYHTDWVYPWWSNQLDKIARVGTHLFFRWRGFWGTPAALSARYRGGEPDPLALEERAEEVERPAEVLKRLIESGDAVRTITAASRPETATAPSAQPGSPAPGVHFVLVAAGDAPAQLVESARKLCPGDRFCQVYGWTDTGVMPLRLPLTDEARAALKFSFLAARSGNREVVYFDCVVFSESSVGMCLPKSNS